ncbi:hypothetical protein O9K63_00480 [Janibacter cremeus]|uniref:PGPGW domain-containing protein n=1 Tax=Janibacter cremeus TaxID=1285192 RepID=UPI0023F96AAE|nr:PGPGW domain-containing protein [Janibacter cremeus]WEV78224.1 hypothetical protein O9K63_00060 [Janibacter cremeus]WEV78304.1 hypothetical protein O9K63_00480 [Janibacter cremeus]
MTNQTKRIAKLTLGWLLVVVGVAALVLPGPGLLALAAGLLLLSQQYEWARRRVEPVRRAALKAAAESVQSAPRALITLCGALLVIAVGAVWGIHPPAPGWWPLPDRWWLFAGWGTGSTLIFSGIVAIGLMIYSWRRFRSDGPETALS